MDSIWKYLVSDFLETACRLAENERDPLLEELGRQKVSAEEIGIHRAFSIAGRIIVVDPKKETAECWLYQSKQKLIEKMRVQTVNGDQNR